VNHREGCVSGSPPAACCRSSLSHWLLPPLAVRGCVDSMASACDWNHTSHVRHRQPRTEANWMRESRIGSSCVTFHIASACDWNHTSHVRLQSLLNPPGFRRRGSNFKTENRGRFDKREAHRKFMRHFSRGQRLQSEHIPLTIQRQLKRIPLVIQRQSRIENRG
jgi:hypothetical protein